jgi:hypothetical protein
MSLLRAGSIAEAITLLCLARLAVAVLSFARLMRSYSVAAENSREVWPSLDRAQTRSALRVRYAIARGIRCLPFEVGCLPQAIAGSVMLGRRSLPSRISLGVPKSGGLPAHAWLEAGNIPITGMAVSDAYAPIARFEGRHPTARATATARRT